MSLKSGVLQTLPHFPGANELIIVYIDGSFPKVYLPLK